MQSVFMRACLNLMAWSLTNEERNMVRDAFIAIDEDRSGTIRLGELQHALETKLDVTSERIRTLFRALDKGRHDEVHYSEFLAAMVCTQIEITDELLTETFKRFDKDNSGYITEDNLQDVLGDTYPGVDVTSLIREADSTHDGRISYQEFKRFLTEQQRPSKRNGNAGNGKKLKAQQAVDHGEIRTTKHKELDEFPRSRAVCCFGLLHFFLSRGTGR
jgi:calcium-dependent protein kinase